MVEEEKTYSEIAANFDRSVKKAKARYVIVGGFAISAWGEPRATEDIDCLIKIPEETVRDLVKALHDNGFQFDPKDIEEAAEGKVERVTIHPKELVPRLDCKVVSSLSEEKQIDNAASLPTTSGNIDIASIEDTIAYKLRHGGSTTDSDIRSILANQKNNIDFSKLNIISDKLGVSSKLKKFIEELE